jgi:predicted transcriptional regulator
MEEYLADLEQGNAPTNVWYSLTTKGYENLSNNMADIKRYLRQILSIVDYYKKSDKTTEEE